jgi:hypothetical protein
MEVEQLQDEIEKAWLNFYSFREGIKHLFLGNEHLFNFIVRTFGRKIIKKASQDSEPTSRHSPKSTYGRNRFVTNTTTGQQGRSPDRRRQNGHRLSPANCRRIAPRSLQKDPGTKIIYQRCLLAIYPEIPSRSNPEDAGKDAGAFRGLGLSAAIRGLISGVPR